MAKKTRAPPPPCDVPRKSAGSSFGLTLTLILALGAAIASHLAAVALLSGSSSTSSIQDSPDSNIGVIVTPCGAVGLISESPVPGLHILCVEEDSEDPANLIVSIFRRSRNETAQNFKVDRLQTDFISLKGHLESELKLRNLTEEAPWSIFTERGERINSLRELLSAPTALIYEGGVFIWPGVRVGHRQLVPLANSKTAVMETLSLRPLVFSIDDFLSESECDYIQEQAAPRVAQSGVSLMDKDRGKAATEWRTSSTYFMASRGHAPLREIDARVAALTKVPTDHQEYVQVLRYLEGQKYDAHHDYFDARLYSKDKGTLAMTRNGKVNRMATVLWYLSDVEGGGETIFPQAGGTPPPRSMANCEVGLKVSPRKGRVIMFYSLTPDGQGDKTSLHGACPVVGSAPKWAANKWVWSASMKGYFDTP